MTRLYIAHSSRDNQAFAALRDVLQRAGYQVWLDTQPRPGGDWRVEIDAAIYNASAVIIIVTPAALESVYVTYEWALALGMGKRVIPVFYQSMRDKGIKMHPRLRTIENFDVAGFNDIQTFYDFFLRELRRLLANVVPPPAPEVQAVAHAPSAPPSPVQPTYNRDVMPTERGHWLVMRRGPNLNAMFRLEKTVITLGRDEANDITIVDNEVSRYHLRLLTQQTPNGVGYAVEDLQSTNGTVINKTRLQPDSPFALLPGAVIYLGDTIILSYEVVV